MCISIMGTSLKAWEFIFFFLPFQKFKVKKCPVTQNVIYSTVRPLSVTLHPEVTIKIWNKNKRTVAFVRLYFVFRVSVAPLGCPTTGADR